MTNQNNPSGMWDCPACGEKLDASFDACWRCGTQPDGTVVAGFESAVEPISSCRRCGYPLRGLRHHQCPECGAFFSSEDVDTTDPHPEPKPPPAAQAPLRWLIAAMASWLTFTIAVTLVTLIDDTRSATFTAATAIVLISVIGSIACPIVFVTLMFSGRR